MYKSISLFLGILLIFTSCQEVKKKYVPVEKPNKTIGGVSLIVLGTAQDAGSPHIACEKECCSTLLENPNSNRRVVALGLLDSKNQKTFLFEATPDITEQLKTLKKTASWSANEIPNGIFLTHAHIGHYTGLMYLGKEATNAKDVTVYAMPKMKAFLEKNGPWSQLVTDKNIVIDSMDNEKEEILTPNLKVIPFSVPHRDEYSETVGYKIVGPNKKALFIPDIDKWEKWETDIIAEIKKVDYAFLDGTFYDAEEINNRDITEIPHPFVIESMQLFENLSVSEKKKIHFIHFNHTNPLLNCESSQFQNVLKKEFQIAQMHQQFEL